MQYSELAREAKRDESAERRTGQYEGGERGEEEMPHIKIQEYKGKAQRRRGG